MRTQYRCHNSRRRDRVAAHATLNGIDWIEVLDRDAPAGSPAQRTLLVHCLKALPALTGGHVRIEGGVRTERAINPVTVTWAFAASDVAAALVPPAERAVYATLADAAKVLVVRTESSGDHSTYRLTLTDGTTAGGAPDDFDPQLTAVDFSFKVECPGDFDCASETVCPPAQREEPELDYLARDYGSFRRLLLDRLSVLMPGWTERHAADLQVTLAELLAYAGDQLSYSQDAVATEAYLGTARRRVSVRRHARLLDYRMHEGGNARTWMCLEVGQTIQRGSATDPLPVPPGARFLTVTGEVPAGVTPDSEWFQQAQPAFEPVGPVHGLFAGHNRIEFHTWSDEQCCLPRGATRATVREDKTRRLHLRAGDVVILEEVAGPKSGRAADANPAQRHAVRLTKVVPEARQTVSPDGVVVRTPDAPVPDLLSGDWVVEIEWGAEDALPFPLCLSAVVQAAGGSEVLETISVARGNVFLVDHGLTLGNQTLVPAAVPATGAYRPSIQRGPLTFAVPAPGLQPASRSLEGDLRQALPAIQLSGEGRLWKPRTDLLGSDPFADEFVVEVDSDGLARLRFGDGILGRRPVPAASFTARYRLGTGRAGNVGAESLTRVFFASPVIARARNPLPARGGRDAESMAEVRQFAPQAFRVQERAVTAADHAAMAERYGGVQRASARFRWTGSWHTAFVSVDRMGGQEVTADFRQEMRDWLERYRLAGQDVEIQGAQYVALDVALQVCVRPGHRRSDVESALLRAFNRHDHGHGARGFFHPDRFTFAQPVFLSSIYAAAMAVAGVASVEARRFQRWGRDPAGELEEGLLQPGDLEIVRLDNDRSLPENGRLELLMGGGR